MQLSFDDLFAMYSEDIPNEPGHYVYRLWADDACLYVGVAGIDHPRKVDARWKDHRNVRGRPWLSKMTRRDVASFRSATEALIEEKLQIAALLPIYNKLGTGRRIGRTFER